MSLTIDTSTDGPLPESGGVSTVEVTIESNAKSLSTTRHVSLLVDASWSMDGEKIEQARTGAERVLDELKDDDYVSLVVFRGGVDVILPMTRWGDADQSEVYNDVTGSDRGRYDGKLDASGGTNIPNALEAAKDQFTTVNTSESATKELIVLSDGQDPREEGVYEQLASELADLGVSISAAGIGSYNADTMLTLSRESGGESYNLDNADEIETFLKKRIIEAGKVVAPNPVVELEMADRFWLNTDDEVYFTKPQAQAKTIEETPNGGRFEIPRIAANKQLQFSFEARASRKQTGPEYDMLDLTVMNNGPIAETSVSIKYEEDPPSKTSITKRRDSAKVVCDFTDTDGVKIEDAIDELEKEGMTKKARQIEKQLKESGKIGVSKLLAEDGKDS